VATKEGSDSVFQRKIFPNMSPEKSWLGLKNSRLAFTLSLTASVVQMAVNLRY